MVLDPITTNFDKLDVYVFLSQSSITLINFSLNLLFYILLCYLQAQNAYLCEALPPNIYYISIIMNSLMRPYFSSLNQINLTHRRYCHHYTYSVTTYGYLNTVATATAANTPFMPKINLIFTFSR